VNWKDFENKFQELNAHSLKPSANATFEEVMNRRKKKKRRVIIYWSFAGLLFVGGLGVALNSKTNSSKSNIDNKVSIEQTENTIIEKNIVDAPKEIDSDNLIVTNQQYSENTESQSTHITSKNPKITKTELSERSTRAAALNLESISSGQSNLHYSKQKPWIEVMSLEMSRKIKNAASYREYLNKNNNQTNSRNISNTNYYSSNLNFNFGGKSLKPISLNWNPQLGRIDWIDGPWDLDPRTPHIDKRPMYVEFSAITGSRSQVDFDLKQTTSILGTQYMAQYQVLLLRETWDEFLWGFGLQYTEWIGNGQWRNVENFDVKVIDTSYRIVKVPGLPNQKIQIIDTLVKQESNTTTGNIGYKMDNLALPISFRKVTSAFRTPLRFGAQLSPGFTTYTRGEYFSATEYQTIGKSRRPTFNAKLSAGPLVQVTGDFSLIIEPSVMYHSFLDMQNNFNGRWFTGLGVSMQWRIK